MNIPNSITNGTVADATDVQQNFDHIESHVNTEVVNRDGSIAMTGELLLPSNPTSNLAAATKSYVDLEVGSEATTRANADTALDTRVTALEGTDIVVTLTGDVTGTGTITDLGDVSFAATVVDDSHNHVVGNIDNFTENVQDIVGAMVSGNTESGISVTYDDTGNSLDFNVNDPTITLTGDVTGLATMTNLGNVSISTTVGDDSHNHVISNVDGLQTALDGKSSSSHTHSYLATSGGTVTGDTLFSSASSSTSNTVALQVTGSNASIALRSNGSASNSGSVVQVRSGRTGDNSRAMAYITQHDGSSMADISVNRVYYSGGSLGSSRTIKENIVSVHPAEGTSAYDTVKQIELSTFNYIGAEASDVQLGVIAEELVDIAPDFVEVHNGIPRWVKGSIHFLTLAALRQAINKIEILEAQVAALSA
jgi:hypothetical protein